MRYALVDKDGLVVNAIELGAGATWAPPDGLSLVESADAGPGHHYDGKQFIASPLPKAVAPPPRPIDGADFLSRFTDDELTHVYSAAQANIQLARWIEILRMRGTIDVNGETAKRAKAALVAAGLLTSDRADLIFARN